MLRKYLSLFIFCALLIRAGAQPLTKDNSFMVNYPFNLGTYSVTDILLEPDGTFLLNGDIQSFNTSAPWYMVKFDANGNINNNFNAFNGIGVMASYIKRIDNGYFTKRSSGTLRRIDFISGYNMDTLFTAAQNQSNPAITGIMNGTASYLDKDNYYWGGCGDAYSPCAWPTNQNPQITYFLFKVTPDGNYDTTFNHNTNSGVTYISPYNDSLLFICGKFTAYDNHNQNRIVRVDLNGNLDTTFKSIFYPWLGPGLQGGGIYPIYVQPDGKILVTGHFNIVGYPLSDVYTFIRLLPNGELDTSFNNNAIMNVFDQNVYTVCPTSDGGYLLGGTFQMYDTYFRKNIVKVDANGFIDTLYFHNSAGFDYLATSVGVPSSVHSIVRDSINDKYYLVGTFDYYEGQYTPFVMRLNGLSVSVDEIVNNKIDFKIYPNPTSDKIKILVNKGGNSYHHQLEIFNVLGEKVKIFNLNSSSTEIDVSDLNQGMYFVSVNSENHKTIRKFLKIN